MTRRPDPFWRVFAIVTLVLACLLSVFIYSAMQPTGRPMDAAPAPAERKGEK